MTITAPSADELRRMMTNQLTAAGALRSEPWIDAFSSIPRHVFVPKFTVRTQGALHTYDQADPMWLTAAYRDTSLLTQFDASGTATSSSTRPSLMATMLGALDVEDGHRVMEIGVGTGYNAALLSHRLGDGQVVSIDVDPELVSVARQRLQEAGYAPTLVAGDGMAGYPAGAPYDRLLATCGVGRVPDAWRMQTRPGGVIVANIGNGVARLAVDGDHGAEGRFLPELAAFMVARSTPDTVSTTAQQLAGPLLARTGLKREITLPTSLSNEVPQFLSSLAGPTVIDFALTDESGRQVHCLFEPHTASWARIVLTDARTAQLNHGGPRDLWAEREPLHRHWASSGQPGPERYGLTIDTEGTHTLWFDSPTGTSWPLAAPTDHSPQG
ncbi:methyltransferase domain-containing protein [Streptomyces celluloflavus]|uniref:Protein-L-isoaspartate O-methyltransferase n=1 Tax=Streptomyces celluloflavus TaxID=58344 RepID=A0ABW7R6L6_9ACTN